MKIFKNLTILATLYFLGVTFLYAASGSGLATVYKINVNKLELCETGSSLTTCLNPITVSKAGLSTDVDLASITAGEVAATLGNFGLAKSGVTYTYVQMTMNRAITIKGSATANSTVCFTKGDGNLNGTHGVAETTSGDSTEATLYVPPFVDATNYPQINSVGDATGAGARIAGTVDASDTHFQARQALAAPFILDPTAIPTVKVAFGTATAVTVSNGASCDGAARMYATPPDATITIQGQ